MRRPMLERAEIFICYFAPWTLDGSVEICKLRFSIMATLANPIEDPLQEFEYPQREAAFFYGLFLRGHSAEELRKEIPRRAAAAATAGTDRAIPATRAGDFRKSDLPRRRYAEAAITLVTVTTARQQSRGHR